MKNQFIPAIHLHRSSLSILFCLLSFFGFTQTTSWKGTTSTDWATATNWTNGVPTENLDAIIGDANHGGIRQPAMSVSSSCKSLTIGGTVASTFSTNNALTISGSLLINSNGSFTQNGNFTVTIKGNWTNNGVYTATHASSRLSFSGIIQFLGGVTATTFKNLAVSSGSSVTLTQNISVANFMTIDGIFLPQENPTPLVVSGTGALVVGGLGKLFVNAPGFADNYNMSGSTTLEAGSTVEYSATTINQTVSSALTYSTLNISGGLTKTLAANLPNLNSSSVNTGNIYITGGSFDIAGFNADRGTTITGGNFSIANGATLKIGSTKTFPVNFATRSLVVSSTVEYNGTNQTVSAQTYGNLSLSSAGGAAVKTFPATALAVVGNLSSSAGAGTSVSFTAAANISISGNVSIGASTVFNGGSFSHVVAGNWVNSGTFNGNTGTVVFAGPGKAISGSGTQNFNNFTVAASMISLSAGSITAAGNVATISSGSFIQAPGGTFLMTGSGASITGSGISLDNLSISGSVSTATSLTLTGNLLVDGSLTSTAGTITMSGVSKTISGAGTRSLTGLSVTGSVSTAINSSISGSLTVNGTLTASAGTITFMGTATLSGRPDLFNVTINGTSLQLSANSVLGIAGALTVTAGTLNVASSPNTINFNGGAQIINSITYCNLTLSNGNIKTAAGNITANGDISIGTGTTFDPGAYTHSINRNWINNGNFTAGSSTIQFLGAANAYISGATDFNILTSNTSNASTQLTLQNNVSAAILNMTKGIILTGTNTVTITNTRTGNGYIYGNIQRTHAFTTGVAYAFEGPSNTIYFSAVSAVTSITVTVTKGAVSDFPFGNSINRKYDIVIPSGTYTANFRLHYEDEELNGNTESEMGLWNYASTQWIPVGKNTNDSIANYVEQTGLTNITNRLTCSINPSVVLWNGSVSSNWNEAANWTVYVGAASTPPSAADVAVLGGIPFTFQPSISTATIVKNIAFSSNQAVALTIAAGGSLTSGDMIGVWSGNATHTINIGNQNLTVNGDLTLSDGIAGHAIDLNIAAGTLSIAGSLLQTGGADITCSGAAALNIHNDFEHESGLFTAGNSTVTYNGNENQDIAHITYNNLTINKTAGIATIDTTINITGNLVVSAGQFDNTGTINLTGNVTIGAGGTLYNSSLLNVAGNWLNNGNYIGMGASTTFNGTGTQTISATTFNNLTFNKPVGSLALLTGDVVIKGNLVGTSGTLDIGTYFFNRDINGGSATMTDSATLIIGADNAPNRFANYAMSPNSTIIFNGTGTQHLLLPGMVYGNIIFRNTGAKILYTSTTVKGNLTIEGGATLDAGSSTVALNGNWINNGTFIPSASLIIFNGTGKTITGNTTFNKVTTYGSCTALSDITTNGLLNTPVGGSFFAGSGRTCTFSGDIINNGTVTMLGTAVISGNVLQTINAVNATIFIATVYFNGSVSPVFNSTSSPVFGTMVVNNTGGIFPNSGWTVLSSLTIGSGASFNGGSFTHNFKGIVNNNGSITSNGTLNFIPASAAAINLGSNFSSSGTVIFGGAGAITLSGSTPSALYNVRITNTNAVGISPVCNWNIGKDLVISDSSHFNAGTYAYNVGGDLYCAGSMQCGTSTVTMSGVNKAIWTSFEDVAFYDLVITGVTVAKSDILIAHNFSNNNSFNASNGVVMFTGGLPSLISGTASPHVLAKFGSQKSPGAVLTLGTSITGVTLMDIKGGTIDMDNYSVAQDSAGGVLIIADSAALKIRSTNSLPVFASYAIDTLSTVEYAGTTQTISSAVPYGNLTLSTPGPKTANDVLHIMNDFNLSNATFVPGSFTDTICGNWNMTSGNFTNTGNTIYFRGINTQRISSTGAFNNFSINKPSGNDTLTTNITVNGTLDFLSGKIHTPGHTITVSPGGTVNGAAQNTGWVYGKLQKEITTGINVSQDFETGSDLSYTPVTVNFASVTNAGNLTAGVIKEDHPNLANSGINITRSVNRYYTFVNSSIVFTTASANLNWVATDVDTGANSVNFRVKSFNGSRWKMYSVTSPTDTSIQATGIISFNDFVVGEFGLPNLETASGFTLFTVNGNVANTGVSHITGDIGTDVGAVTGFGTSTVTGTIYSADSLTAQCATDVKAAYEQLYNTPATNTSHAPAFGGGETVYAGVYFINGAGSVSADLTLDAQGNPDAVFIFKINGAFSTAAASSVHLVNGAIACNVFWLAEGAIAMGASTIMEGTLISNNGDATMAAGGSLAGRMFSTTGAIATDAVMASLPACFFGATLWTGSASTDWNTAANWSPGVPASTMNITIPTGLSRYPLINTGTGTVKNIVIEAGASVIVNAAKLQIGGSITNHGTFVVSSGTIELNGAQAQIISANTFAGNTINNLIISNNVTLAGRDTITGTLSFGNVNGKLLTTGDSLVLKSTATYTARIGDITNGGVNSGNAFSGKITVQRYMPGRRKYRMMGSAVTSSASATLSAGQEALSIWGNWQNMGNNVAANTGTIITGGTAADGFDQQTQNVSMYTYDDSLRKFTGFASSKGKNTKYTPLKAGLAYYIFIYGDRTNTISTSNPKNTTLNETGTVLTGTQTYNISSATPLSNVTGRFTMLGNPYASPIDWTTVTKTNIENTYWGWDPNLNSLGGFVTVTSSGAGTIISPFSASTVLNQYIQTGQGFFVKTTGPSPVLTIREQDKVPNYTAPAFGNNSQPNSLPLVAVNLTYMSGTNRIMADGAVAAFDPSFSNQTGAEDAMKMDNTAETVSFVNGTDYLSINARKMPLNNDSLFLKIARLTRPQYNLQIFTQQLGNQGVLAYLQDLYLNTKSLLWYNDTNNIVFNVNPAVPASFDANRFRIVFTDPGAILPIKFISIKAVQKSNAIQVEWDVADESGVQQYDIMRSADGNNFSKAGTITAAGNSGYGVYKWLDEKPCTGNNFYRIRAAEANGQITLSPVVVVAIKNVASSFIVSPNPVKDQQIHLYAGYMEKGMYNLQLINTQGQLVLQADINHPGGAFDHFIYSGGKLPAAMYYLHIMHNQLKFTQSVLFQ